MNLRLECRRSGSKIYCEQLLRGFFKLLGFAVKKFGIVHKFITVICFLDEWEKKTEPWAMENIGTENHAQKTKSCNELENPSLEMQRSMN
ncbi:Rapamycin-Insensitive Companion Of Mtor [Manis pentadactyla]|nr:Rapamycin-Insensitive Companion Of Mtor [Manis pentadactyla]